MLVQEPDDAAVLTGVELIELVDRELEITFGNFEACFELADVCQIIDIDLCCGPTRA
jgi:hypothetical protein